MSDDSVSVKPRHGGARPNAGRKPGQGKYGEASVPVRIPRSMEREVLHYIENKGFNLPVFGMRVPMGPLAASIDYVERTMNLNELIRHPWATFFHPVQGDSMEPTVSPGDLAMIDANIEPMHNDVVLASIDGDVTLKRLMKKNGHTWLQPDNAKHAPIEFQHSSENYICGVMLVAIRPVSTNHIRQF